MRLRQVATAARDLEPVVEDFCAVLGVEVAYRDPGVGEFGLRNAVMPIGDTFLEVVSPEQDDTAAGRYLDRHGELAGYMVILQTEEDMDAFRARMASHEVRTVWKADHPDMRGTHLHPKDVGGAILSVDWADPPSSWRWAGPDWQSKVRTEVVSGIVGVELSSKKPASLAKRWGELLGETPAPGDDGVWWVELGRGRLRFRPAAGGPEGLTGIDLAVVDLEHVLKAAFERRLECSRARVRMGGVDFHFLE